MINVTDKAAKTLSLTLDQNQEENKLLRLNTSGESFVLTLDEQQDEDQVITHEDKPVLLIAPSISSALDGAVVDVAENDSGSQLIIQSAK
jgi:Fe-S cluster assembly iron-binding protein IscA